MTNAHLRAEKSDPLQCLKLALLGLVILIAPGQAGSNTDKCLRVIPGDPEYVCDTDFHAPSHYTCPNQVCIPSASDCTWEGARKLCDPQLRHPSVGGFPTGWTYTPGGCPNGVEYTCDCTAVTAEDGHTIINKCKRSSPVLVACSSDWGDSTGPACVR